MLNWGRPARLRNSGGSAPPRMGSPGHVSLGNGTVVEALPV